MLLVTGRIVVSVAARGCIVGRSSTADYSIALVPVTPAATTLVAFSQLYDV